jgi:hypothetical protein
MTTKILALTDALGNLVRFELLPGNRHDTIGVAPLIEGIEFGALLGDKAFDANWPTGSCKTLISAEPRSSSHSTRVAPRSSKSTPRCTNAAISSKTSLPNSKNSNATP